MAVPPPTFCPACRFERRLSFFNMANLWKRTCGLCEKEFVSSYHPQAPYVTYCPACWWSDNWDPFSYGRDYDFSRPFFDQMQELWRAVPLLGISIGEQIIKDSPYTNFAGRLKNCYLLFHGSENEDVAYGFDITRSRRCYDSSVLMQCERLYDSMHNYQCNRGVGFRQQVDQSIDCFFLRDASNCRNCFGSANLRNKKYVWMNEECAKEEYEERLKNWDSGSYAAYARMRERVYAHWDSLPYRAQFDGFSTGSTGYNFFFSKNCKECYEVYNAENCKYMALVKEAKDSYDITSWGKLELGYDSCLVGGSNIKCSFLVNVGARNGTYSVLQLAKAAHVFGSVSIKDGNYAILNKRYSKDDYFAMLPKIVEHMNKMPYVQRLQVPNAKSQTTIEYRYGEFFPPEMSPYSYNETLAQKIFPLDEGSAAQKGLLWRSEERPRHAVTLAAADLPDHIKDARDTITKEVIGCESCGKGFRIIPDELAFLRDMKLPLPRQCPFCRIDEKLDIWTKELTSTERTCTKCGAKTRTSTLLKDKPVLYCNSCYQKAFL